MRVGSTCIFSRKRLIEATYYSNKRSSYEFFSALFALYETITMTQSFRRVSSSEYKIHCIIWILEFIQRISGLHETKCMTNAFSHCHHHQHHHRHRRRRSALSRSLHVWVNVWIYVWMYSPIDVYTMLSGYELYDSADPIGGGEWLDKYGGVLPFPCI